MWWNKKKKLKKKREITYLELNEKFLKKHSFISDWYMRKYLLNKNGLQPITEEGIEYQKRMKDFFSRQYGMLPKSFNPVANINLAFDDDFDPYPIVKLQDLYTKIVDVFPESFTEKLICDWDGGDELKRSIIIDEIAVDALPGYIFVFDFVNQKFCDIKEHIKCWLIKNYLEKQKRN